MGITNVNDIKNIEEILSSRSISQINESIEARIIKSKYIDNSNFINLSLYFNKIRCDQFIINENNFKIPVENIEIKLDDIKLKMIKNKNYLEIKKYNKSDKNLEVPISPNIYKFNLPEKISDLKENNNLKKIISIKLKVKEIDLINSFKYELLSIFNNNIIIDSLEKYPDDIFENDKIYLFNGFYYDNNILYKTNFSSIEIIDENSLIEDNNFPENINNINIGEIINIKGIIKDLLMEDLTVIIEEISSKEEIKIKLNYDLIKKINPNKECEFINFKKLDNNNFELTKFSDIYSNWDTAIELKVKDIQNIYYDRINIDNKEYINIDDNIKGDIIKFSINGKNKSIIFDQKFIFEKTRLINNNNGEENIIVENSYEFYLEINKGRINSYPCFLNKEGGFTYQIYFQTKEEGILPEKIKIKLANNNIMELDDFETFDNKLKKRITIINVVKQDFTFTDKTKNIKIYYIIKVKEENNIFEKASLNQNESGNKFFVFDLLERNDAREDLNIKEEDQHEINYLFKIISDKNYEVDNNDKLKINYLLEEKNYKDILEKGLKKYNFHNSKKEYNIIKKLLFLFFCQKLDEYILEYYLIHFKYTFPILNKVDYLTRIKIFLYYYRYYEEKSLLDNPIIDIYDEGNNKYKNYKPFFDAFKLFYKIMDNQQEKYPFYQSINQFNGTIRKELIRDIKIYSGSIISMKDIKFELIKRVSSFLFVDLKSKNEPEAIFSLENEMITFHPLSFMKKINFDNIEKRLSSVLLFLIIQEVCGPLKINNNQSNENSQSYENLNLIYSELWNKDSGRIFEGILKGNVIDYWDMLQNQKSEELLDVKFYIQDNFDDLEKKLEEFSPKIIINDNDEIDEINQNEDYKLLKPLLIQLKEVKKNLNKYNYNTLYPLFRIPKGMTKQRFKELLKDNIVYKKFMRMLPADDEKY